MPRHTSELYLGQDDNPPHAWPEAEMPRIDECAGYTPTKNGDWIGRLVIKAKPADEASPNNTETNPFENL